MVNQYYIAKTSAGYVVYEQGHMMSLPFNWISQSGAYEACAIFNEGGYRAVAEYYYVHKVAGTRDIRYMLEKGINPYDEWMSKNGDMFKREGVGRI